MALWYRRLRWFAFSGQIAVLFAAVYIFSLTLPTTALVSTLLLIPVSNLLSTRFVSDTKSEKRVVGVLLTVDTAILTAVLALAGGPTNPFTLIYLLHVVLAAVMLTPSWTWGIALLTAIGFGFQFLFNIPVPEWSHHGGHHGFSLHLHGMFFAYVVAASLTAYFLSRIVSELQRKDRRLNQLELLRTNQARLASLTAISAGAAHELGTPLSTIAVVAHELERSIRLRYPESELLADLALLKNETERCKDIIQSLGEQTGDLSGEVPSLITVSELLIAAAELSRKKFGAKISISASPTVICTPKRAALFALEALIGNAFEAGSAEVRLEAVDTPDGVAIQVVDYGGGMTPDALTRLGEPFFSTKAPGRGMGLGVYLSKITIERLGGSLSFSSRPGHGTVARVELPKNCLSGALAA